MFRVSGKPKNDSGPRLQGLPGRMIRAGLLHIPEARRDSVGPYGYPVALETAGGP